MAKIFDKIATTMERFKETLIKREQFYHKVRSFLESDKTPYEKKLIYLIWQVN